MFLSNRYKVSAYTILLALFTLSTACSDNSVGATNDALNECLG